MKPINIQIDDRNEAEAENIGIDLYFFRYSKIKLNVKVNYKILKNNKGSNIL
jgi:hypothetical protein